MPQQSNPIKISHMRLQTTYCKPTCVRKFTYPKERTYSRVAQLSASSPASSYSCWLPLCRLRVLGWPAAASRCLRIRSGFSCWEENKKRKCEMKQCQRKTRPRSMLALQKELRLLLGVIFPHLLQYCFPISNETTLSRSDMYNWHLSTIVRTGKSAGAASRSSSMTMTSS